MVERRSWIPMGDGARLAASLFLPEGVGAGRAAPVVLEALPYGRMTPRPRTGRSTSGCVASTGMRWPGSTCGDGVGGRSQLPDGGALIERYRGAVGAGPDGETWARGSALYRIEWPEATVATSVRLDLEAREGDEPRWARSWRRRIPRRLG
jgi:hypothetical protein